LLVCHSTLKLEDHPLSAFCDFLLNIFAATLHGGHLFYPQSETAPCHGDRNPLGSCGLDASGSG